MGDTKKAELRVVVMWESEYSRRDQAALSMASDFRQPPPIFAGNMTLANFMLAFRGALSVFFCPLNRMTDRAPSAFVGGARSYFRRAQRPAARFQRKRFSSSRIKLPVPLIRDGAKKISRRSKASGQSL